MGEQQASDPNAMPLTAFIEEAMHILETQPRTVEVVVERCRPLRYAETGGKMDAMFAAINAPSH